MLEGLKTVFPIKPLVKLLAHGKHIIKGCYYHPDLTKNDLELGNTSNSVSTEEVWKGALLSLSLDLNPSHSQGPKKGRTCSPDHIPGPNMVFLCCCSSTTCQLIFSFAFRLCPQSTTLSLPLLSVLQVLSVLPDSHWRRQFLWGLLYL